MRSCIYLFLIVCQLTACAPKRAGMLPPDRLRDLGCRIVTVAGGSVKTIVPIVDGNLDTVSNDPADQTIEALIHDNKRLAARIEHVNIRLPRDRFNVTLMLDGKTIIRANHMDLDIYIETTIDGNAYALHCFPEYEGTGE